MTKTIMPLPEHPGVDDELLVLTEIDKLQKFLSSKRLWVPKNFLHGIRAHDIIEIYSYPEYKQIYANDEFSHLSSYTPEQMQSIPFQQLFWRADEDQIMMLERSTAIAKAGKLAEKWDVPKHELVESLHPRKRTFEMSMELIAPCFSSETGLRLAFASTLRVDLIYEWPEAV